MHDRLTELLEPAAGIFHVDSVEAMVLRILGAMLVLLAAFWISGTTQRYLVRRLRRQDTGDAQAIHTYRQIVQTVVWVAGGAIALHTLGIDLTHIFTAGGLFAVALAFAMKDLAENLVSGLLLRPGGGDKAQRCAPHERRRNCAGKDNRITDHLSGPRRKRIASFPMRLWPGTRSPTIRTGILYTAWRPQWA